MAAHRRGYYRQTVAEGQGVWTEEEDNSGSFARLRAAFTVSTTLQLRNTRTAPQPEYFLLTANQRRRPRFSNHRLSRTLHQQVDQFQCTIRKWNNDKQRRSKGILGRIDEWDPPTPFRNYCSWTQGFLIGVRWGSKIFVRVYVPFSQNYYLCPSYNSETTLLQHHRHRRHCVFNF